MTSNTLRRYHPATDPADDRRGYRAHVERDGSVVVYDDRGDDAWIRAEDAVDLRGMT